MKILSLILIVLLLMVEVCFSQGTKITDLTELSAKPADGDYFLIVDVSDSSMAATGTNKKITRSNVFSGVPWDLNWSLYNPSTDMINLCVARTQRAITITSIGCIVDPDDTEESVTVRIYECDSNGDNCAAIINEVICGNTPTSSTVSDSSLAANAVIRLNVITVTGTVKSLLIYGTGTQNF